MSETGFVVGNGPSLRGFDLTRLDPAVTIGMNAAYRHWHEIGWYPRYYCCLDDQLIETHHDEIDRLYTDGLVHEFFLHGHFFELHPERIGNPAFLSFDQVSPHWHGQRGQKMGLPFLDHPAFRSSDTSKVTTGAYAVRYMAYRGFERIALLGIDLRYIEQLPQATPTDGVGMVMTETPATNPNYFFDDYQREGDRFNIPNPDVHQGKLHLRSFELVGDDFAANGIVSDIVDTNPGSLLREHDIFPLANLDSEIERSREDARFRLGAVVVPCTRHDVDQIVANLHFWSDPAYSPYAAKPLEDKPVLAFVFNNASAASYAARIRESFEALPVRQSFERLEITFLDLEGARDAYIRSHKISDSEFGYKAGPNNQFFGAMAFARRFGRYAFLMEADCVPVRAGWLAHLQMMVSTPDTFWVAGSAYRGKGRLEEVLRQHINGNAIYACGDPAFQRFLKRVWEPTLWQVVRQIDQRAAYDFALDYARQGMRGDMPKDAAWDFWRSHAHLFRYTDFIVNLSGDEDMRSPDRDMVVRALHSKTTYIVHSGALARALPEALQRADRLPVPTALIPIAVDMPDAPKMVLPGLPRMSRDPLKKLYLALPSPLQRMIRRVLGRS